VKKRGRTRTAETSNEIQDQPRVVGLDAQLCELVETVCERERRWSAEDRIDAAIGFRRTIK
jgi:hypothetical protein